MLPLSPGALNACLDGQFPLQTHIQRPRSTSARSLGNSAPPSGPGTGSLGNFAPRLATHPASLGNFAPRLATHPASLGNFAPRLLPRGRSVGNFSPRLRGAKFPTRSEAPQRTAQTRSEVPQRPTFGVHGREGARSSHWRFVMPLVAGRGMVAGTAAAHDLRDQPRAYARLPAPQRTPTPDSLPNFK